MTHSLSVVPDQPEPLAEWLRAVAAGHRRPRPAQPHTITLDRILPQLVPGILQLSERGLYFSIYSWTLWQVGHVAANLTHRGEVGRILTSPTHRPSGVPAVKVIAAA